MRKLLLFLFSLPMFALAQNTVFTPEQEQFVEDFKLRIQNEVLPKQDYVDEYIKEVNEALSRVPHHPELVDMFLMSRFTKNDIQGAYDYCTKLNDHYLSTFQKVLTKNCAAAYRNHDDFEGLFHRIIPLITDENIKGLFLTDYFLHKGDDENFMKHAELSLSKKFKYPVLEFLKKLCFTIYVSKKFESDQSLNSQEEVHQAFKAFIKKHEETIFTAEDISVGTYFLLIEKSINLNDFDTASKLMDYVFSLNPQNEAFSYPLKSLFYFQKNSPFLATTYLEKSFDKNYSNYVQIIEGDFLEVNLSNFFIKLIDEVDDIQKRNEIRETAITFFEHHGQYKVKLMLAQSLDLIVNDFKKSKEIFISCKPKITLKGKEIFEKFLDIEEELNKKVPNYKLIGQWLTHLQTNFEITNLHLKLNLARLKVVLNRKLNQSLFDFEAIVDEFDELLKNARSSHEQFEIQTAKFIVIGYTDMERALFELEKLPEDLQEKLLNDVMLDDETLEQVKEKLAKQTSSFDDDSVSTFDLKNSVREHVKQYYNLFLSSKIYNIE